MAHARLDLKIGFACNNRCRFCVQGDKRSRYGPPPFARLRAELAAARPAADGVVLTGGEPTLRKDLFALIGAARELGYSTVQVQTNGRMAASRRWCADAVAAGATEFSPALHGHRPELHDWLTRAPGSFAQTVRGIRNLRELGQRVLTNSVIVRPNFRNLPELARLLVALDVDQLQLAFVHPAGSAAEGFTAIVPRFALAAPYLARALREGTRAGKPCWTEAVPPCVLPGLERHVVEGRIPRTKVVDAESTIEDYRAYRVGEGKMKGPRCRECAFDGTCEGPWREYPERYGFDELVPVARGAAPAGA